MKRFFTEKVISLGTAVIIILLCIAGTYLVTVSVSSGSASMPELPTLPPINTEKPIADDEELFLYACIERLPHKPRGAMSAKGRHRAHGSVERQRHSALLSVR